MRAGIGSCFSPPKTHPYASYRPLYFWTDADKALYKEWRGIQYSDCYEVWGFQRTGCLGCPCASKAEQELETALAYEPHKVKAAYAIFGKSYEYRREYIKYKEQRKKERHEEALLRRKLKRQSQRKRQEDSRGLASPDKGE